MVGPNDTQSRGSGRARIVRRFTNSAYRRSGLEEFCTLSATALGTALILELGLVGCTNAPVLRPSSTLPAAALETPQRYLIVTVPNPVDTVPSHAASTPRGYDNVGGPYLAGNAARRASRAIAVAYRLREVSSWPIAVLRVNCIVYELPADADLAQLLSTLARDTRIKTAQPLFEFVVESALSVDP